MRGSDTGIYPGYNVVCSVGTRKQRSRRPSPVALASLKCDLQISFEFVLGRGQKTFWNGRFKSILLVFVGGLKVRKSQNWISEADWWGTSAQPKPGFIVNGERCPAFLAKGEPLFVDRHAQIPRSSAESQDTKVGN